jgi:CsoR family transcriptional regulator, copper-sensing transcriptional repressor
MGVYSVLNDEAKAKARGRLRRIEGQVQGLQRMIEADAYCVDVLLQISAVQGALEQVQKLLLGRHIESCVTDALRTGSRSERQQKIEELLEVFSRFGGA